ncbi:succinyltransferase-like protein [Arcticibacter pallidicorallinus]|uniref:Succinyltransferase-like protein n=1 Tax=Arcticibacter pallidicorallinus TaxID=1259464 RepID=A0A2T0U6X9_9SPHI|nr:acyltransferase [Arcticibacter pallidicorallinus]PRY53667.1 succinyltransferase-like protein [Arcticibacter pallidicorallinus]
MNRYIKILLFKFGRLLGRSGVKYIFKHLKVLQNCIMSGYVSSDFDKVHSSFSIKSPVSIIGAKYISVGQNFCCLPRLRIEVFRDVLTNPRPSVKIGKGVSVGSDFRIACVNEVVIGDDVLIGSRVTITDHLHGKANLGELHVPPNIRELFSRGSVIIRSNVHIGDGVFILPGIEIGEGSIVGANSVVTKSIPAFSICAGAPARSLRQV